MIRARPSPQQRPEEPASPKAARAAAGILLGALAAAVYLGTEGRGGSEPAGLAALALHALLFLAAVPFLLRALRGKARGAVVVGGVVLLLLGGACWIPEFPARRAVVAAHVCVGAAALLFPLWLLAARLPGRVRRPALSLAAFAGVLVPAVYGLAEQQHASWAPPRYDADACYRFLTATNQEQSGEPFFPSALRTEGAPAQDCRSCHADAHAGTSFAAHLESPRNPAYQATFGDFVRRRGEGAGRWCQGCHDPDALAGDRSHDREGCVSCHAATDTHALFGSAALQLGAATDGPAGRLGVSLRAKNHADRTLRPELHRSAEFCASCHRKSWSLPQNGYRWISGPDEYQSWQSSRFSGAALFAPGTAAEKSCVGCHAPHGSAKEREPEPAGAGPYLELDAFLRSPDAGGDAWPAEEARAGSGPTLLLDVPVRNSGIGHDFPTGMPDLYESWLEVTVRDRSGRIAARSGYLRPDGSLEPGAHAYRLVGVDRAGRTLRHGELDEMVSLREWRRIPPGECDLARFQLRVPDGGAGRITVRMLRRRRPDFDRWAGIPASREPEVLARWDTGEEVRRPAGERWREYGRALAAVKAYPQAIRSLNRALALSSGDVEVRLALGRLYLEEGDLLGAREAFNHAAASGAGKRARAWLGAVLRRMGQPEQAIELLQPLAKQHPRDRRLRFELGMCRMALLQNREAAREFQAVLDVDPTDVSAHYNLMLCWQRLNRLSDAAREEVIYRLLKGGESAAGSSQALESRPLHVHVLEAAR